MPYDPRKAYLSGEQYINDPNYLSAELADRITRDVRTLCRALGYDINTVEFAIRDGVPFAIDFMNPAPDADLHSVGEFYHQWVTSAVTELVFKRLAEPRGAPRYRWDALLNPAPESTVQTAVAAVASAAEQAARTIIPQPVREVPADIIAGVNDLVAEATNVVSEIIGSTAEPQEAQGKTAQKGRASSKSKTGTKKNSTARKSKTAPEA